MKNKTSNKQKIKELEKEIKFHNEVLTNADVYDRLQQEITQLKSQLKQQRKKIEDRINAIRSKKCPSNEILSNAIISELEALLQNNFTVKEDYK